MATGLHRRQFLRGLGAGAALVSLNLGCRHTARTSFPHRTQPIRGSWINIWWDDRRHLYWNDACLKFTAEQWQLAVKDAADLGFEYLVLLAVAKGGKAFYDTPFLPKLEMACADPIGALLTGGDRYGVKFFIIAYQDEVGCLRMTADQSAAAFERLRRAHHRVPQRALWADVEVFAWEGPPNQPTSPLIPAPFARLRAQLEAVSPYVDKILIYQFQGLMNKRGSRAFAGHPESIRLYEDYLAYKAADLR